MSSTEAAPTPRLPVLEGARCVGLTDLMYADADERDDVEAAKAVCAACTASAECLERALRNDERFGVWASVNFGNQRERSRARQRLAS